MLDHPVHRIIVTSPDNCTPDDWHLIASIMPGRHADLDWCVSSAILQLSGDSQAVAALPPSGQRRLRVAIYDALRAWHKVNGHPWRCVACDVMFWMHDEETSHVA